MAAYDWGPGNVQRAVARTGYADFWELYRLGALPGETRNYVPGIIAAIIMAKNPQQYGLTDMVPDAPLLSDTITTSYAIDLRLVADVTNSTLQEIVALNPALLRLSTPSDIAYDLHLPPGSKDVYLTRLKDIPEDNRASWRFHVVKDGETLDDIATALHARAGAIASFNGVTATDPISAGDELVVPMEAASTPGQQRYTVRRGDTLVTVADRFGLTVEQMQEWNRLQSSRVAPGRSLYVVEPVRLAPGMHLSRHHRGRSAHASSHASSYSSGSSKSRKKRSY
jgi:membrane-bound lytic murein transglycosylase D